jgi:hypothetical protein
LYNETILHMKISGFSICRNAVKFDFPIVEVIRSALPLVDEFIVNVGQSDDGTLDLIRSIGSDKVRVVESVWDDSMKKDGLLFSHETNVALSHCQGDWALYLQADEVLHEAELGTIRNALHRHLTDPTVLAQVGPGVPPDRSQGPGQTFWRDDLSLRLGQATAGPPGKVPLSGGAPSWGQPGSRAGEDAGQEHVRVRGIRHHEKLFRLASGCEGGSHQPVSGAQAWAQSLAAPGLLPCGPGAGIPWLEGVKREV